MQAPFNSDDVFPGGCITWITPLNYECMPHKSAGVGRSSINQPHFNVIFSNNTLLQGSQWRQTAKWTLGTRTDGSSSRRLNKNDPGASHWSGSVWTNHIVSVKSWHHVEYDFKMCHEYLQSYNQILKAWNILVCNVIVLKDRLVFSCLLLKMYILVYDAECGHGMVPSLDHCELENGDFAKRQNGEPMICKTVMGIVFEAGLARTSTKKWGCSDKIPEEQISCVSRVFFIMPVYLSDPVTEWEAQNYWFAHWKWSLILSLRG